MLSHLTIKAIKEELVPLGKVIDNCQSAFLGERKLLYRVRVANAVMEDAKRRKKRILMLMKFCI